MRHSLRYHGAFGSLQAILVSGLTFRRLSPSCKILFPARMPRGRKGVEVTLSRAGNSGGIGLQSQRFVLAATPIGVQVSQAFDVEAARQSILYRCIDQLGREKGEGECQIDLTRRALGQLLGAGYRGHTQFHLTIAGRALWLSDETDPPFGAVRPDIFPLGTVGQSACPSVAQMLREVTRGFGLSAFDSKNCLDFAHASAEERTCSENSPSSSPLRRRSAAAPAPAGR